MQIPFKMKTNFIVINRLKKSEGKFAALLIKSLVVGLRGWFENQISVYSRNTGHVSVFHLYSIIYISPESELVVFRRPLPLPRTMGPLSVGRLSDGAKQTRVGGSIEHYISVSGPRNPSPQNVHKIPALSLGGCLE